MNKRGGIWVFLFVYLVFSILYFSGFVNAAGYCLDSPYINCNYYNNNQWDCTSLSPYCQWDSWTYSCNNGAYNCGQIEYEEYCRYEIGCVGILMDVLMGFVVIQIHT